MMIFTLSNSPWYLTSDNEDTDESQYEEEKERKEIEQEAAEESLEKSYFQNSSQEYKIREGARNAKEDANLKPFVNHFVNLC